MMKLYTITFLSFIFISFNYAQQNDSKHQHSRNNDPKHSVFGPQIQPEWKFQLAHMGQNNEGVSAINLYRQDQRGKTLFLTLLNNGLDYSNQYRVQEISGGAILFPFNDDDRYQLDIGGTYDKIKDSSKSNKILFSRFTVRPSRELWLRAGFEYYDGHKLGHGANPYSESSLTSYYAAVKYNFGFVSPIAILGSGKIDSEVNNRFGGGSFIFGPLNTFLFGGFINSSDSNENIRTLAIGRWAPFRPDNYPSGFFVWKHRSDYDFQLGGLFLGERNLLVRPAALGMITGMFVSSVTLRANSQLRQRKLMTITNDYESFDYSFFYVHLNQKISGGQNNVGFSVFQFYKLFSDITLSIFSEPVIGIFYNEETNPTFDAATFSLVDKKETYYSYQFGFKIINRFLIEGIHSPSKEEFTIAFSYLLK